MAFNGDVGEIFVKKYLERERDGVLKCWLDQQ